MPNLSKTLTRKALPSAPISESGISEIKQKAIASPQPQQAPQVQSQQPQKHGLSLPEILSSIGMLTGGAANVVGGFTGVPNAGLGAMQQSQGLLQYLDAQKQAQLQQQMNELATKNALDVIGQSSVSPEVQNALKGLAIGDPNKALSTIIENHFSNQKKLQDFGLDIEKAKIQAGISSSVDANKELNKISTLSDRIAELESNGDSLTSSEKIQLPLLKQSLQKSVGTVQKPLEASFTKDVQVIDQNISTINHLKNFVDEHISVVKGPIKGAALNILADKLGVESSIRKEFRTLLGDFSFTKIKQMSGVAYSDRQLDLMRGFVPKDTDTLAQLQGKFEGLKAGMKIGKLSYLKTIALSGRRDKVAAMLNPEEMFYIDNSNASIDDLKNAVTAGVISPEFAWDMAIMRGFASPEGTK